MTIEASRNPAKLEALTKLLEPFGVREIVQSGMVALGRGPRSITSSAARVEAVPA
jgi:acetolactate synthase-1/3 small subunit